MDGALALLAIAGATFGVAIASGVIPLINLEIYLVGVVLAAGGVGTAVVLGLCAAAGQMVAKAGLYGAALGATELTRRRHGKGIDRARAMVARWRGKPLSLLFVSGSVGLPPFYIVSLAAGLLGVGFRAFMLVGFAGRAVRFVAIAVLAAIA